MKCQCKVSSNIVPVPILCALLSTVFAVKLVEGGMIGTLDIIITGFGDLGEAYQCNALMLV